MTPVYTFIVAVALLVLLLAGWLLAARRRELRQRYREHCQNFFAISREIAASPEAPLEVAVLLRHMGATINDGLTLLFLASESVCRVGLRLAKGSPAEREYQLLERGYDEAPQSVRDKFDDAFREAVLAVSYRSILLGPLVRRDFRRLTQQDGGMDRKLMEQMVRQGHRPDEPDFTDPLRLLKTA